MENYVASSKWRPSLKFRNIKHSFNLTSDMKRSSQIMPENIFHDDVIDDVTGLPRIRPYIILYKWNSNIFHDNWKSSNDIIIKLPLHQYHETMTTFVWIHIHDVIDDVTRSQSRSNFQIDISPSIFELQHWSKAQMLEMLMAIVLIYSTSGITSGEKVCRELKMAAILKILIY